MRLRCLGTLWAGDWWHQRIFVVPAPAPTGMKSVDTGTIIQRRHVCPDHRADFNRS
jgi:hypothetical protein